MSMNMANDEWTPPKPQEIETFGKDLAVRAADLGADTVLTWNQPEDAVLGHIVARELRVGIVYADEVEGILDTFGGLEGRNVLVVFAEAPKASDITALSGLIASSTARVAGVFGPDGAVAH